MVRPWHLNSLRESKNNIVSKRHYPCMAKHSYSAISATLPHDKFMNKLRPFIFMMLFFSMAIQPCSAGRQHIVIGTLFSQTKDNLVLYHAALADVVEQENQASEARRITLLKQDYDGACKNKVEKVHLLLDQDQVTGILMDEGCASQIGSVLKGTRLENHHLMVTFIPPTTPIGRPWLKIILPKERPLTTSVTLQLIDKQSMVDEELQDNLIAKVDFSTPVQSSNRAIVSIPSDKFVHLHSFPEKPGTRPDPEKNPVKATLESGAEVKLGNISSPKTTTDYCRKIPGTKKVYSWIYTTDWTCVKVVKSDDPDNQGKTGWIHSFLLKTQK